MMFDRRRCLVMLFAATALPAVAQERGLPPAVSRALRRYPDARVQAVRIRQGASTAQGFMYEVSLRGPDGAERIVYVDPDDGRVLYETDGIGR